MGTVVIVLGCDVVLVVLIALVVVVAGVVEDGTPLSISKELTTTLPPSAEVA
jgi:Na+-transporting methylmalonyl-CoA/oxaloacetate decarboxylase gamma subunit